MPYLIYIVIAFVSILLGYWLRKQRALTQINSAELRAETILAETKNKEKKLILEAQDKALKIIEQAKIEASDRHKEVSQLQERLEQRENLFSQKLLELQDKQQALYDKVSKVEEAKEQIHKIREEQTAVLEKVAHLTRDEAQEKLFERLEKDSREALTSRLKKLENETSETIDEKARELVSAAMQRLSSNFITELTTTTVELPNDDLKGRIIGREGRNIKSIEQLTGVEIIVDDTPNAITISGFSAIRRHIAKQALEILIKDGRIHPTKIEEAIDQAKRELALDIKKAGEEALYELGITGFDPKLVQIIGRLKYRTSYGQNALKHAVEVSHLCGLLAESLGADVSTAKKGGLLHDIGKAVDHEVKGSHPEIGGQIARKFGLSEAVIAPIEKHHEDHPSDIVTIIVKVADAISSSRPGARHDSFEQYVQRLEELEKLTQSFEGVEKVYAIQAGREVRVFVKAEEVSDLKAHEMAKDIAKKIEEELKYPGEIKVNLLRETRVIEYAR
ncbi:ribonuclease Y [Candidatus Falkowbacteria bacterium]|nr:MAG: ribonuclease Y [Candidatus Falkowbacteria bacterium]